MVHPTVRCYYIEDIGSARQAVRDSVDNLFPTLLRYDQLWPATDRRIPSTATGVECLARTAVQAILRAAHPRSVPRITDLNRALVEDRVAQCIRRHVPISGQILWSPKKHWIVGADSKVDLAELTALNTLLTVHTAVRSIYHSGLTFTLHLEDLEFEFMEGSESELKESRNRYIAGLQGMIHVLGIQDIFTVVRISDKARDKQELRGWVSQMEENYRALKAYWYDSESKGIAGYEAYPSFRALRRLGWNGPIPEEMRNYYLRRLNFHQDRPKTEKVSMILRNLAGILLHYQKNLLGTASEVEPIKFSFVPPAPGAPAELIRGRIDLRFVSRNVCSLVGSAGPWSTKGYFRERHGRIMPTFKSWHSPTEPGSRLVDGHLTLSCQDQAVSVRADFLLEDICSSVNRFFMSASPLKSGPYYDQAGTV